MNMRTLISGSALAAIMAGTPSIVSGQGSCVVYEPLRRVMEESGIRIEGAGRIDLMNGTSTAIEVWISPSNEWAVLAIDATGIACIILSGVGWAKPERL